jgi:hypothetical protein
VIQLVNDELVPVWIDVRTTPVPDIPALRPVLAGLKIELEGGRRVPEKHLGFLLISAVTTYDGAILLNPEATDAPLGMLFDKGHFPYARVTPEDYLAMLRKALAFVSPTRSPPGRRPERESAVSLDVSGSDR